ncbi:MAG: ComF family protein [Bacillota bacterium]|nr:ComF family protein [Bacillota bacterium]
MKMKSWFGEISEWIFPSNIYCISCGSLIDKSRPYSLCDKCIKEFRWIGEEIPSNCEEYSKGSISRRTCCKCGKALQDDFHGDLCYDCMEIDHYFEKGYSCLSYGQREREIMMDIKYNNKGYLAHKMGEILFDRMAGIIYEGGVNGEILFDIVTPVPVSTRRLSKRGYNQSELMAKTMLTKWTALASENPGVMLPRFEPHLLYRVKETKMLRGLNPAERRYALKEAFAVRRGSEERLADKTVLLIDDIYTTGATADACSKVLLEGGAEKVILLTLASGGNRRKIE